MTRVVDENLPQDEHAADKIAKEPAEHPDRPMTIEEAARKGGTTKKEPCGPDSFTRLGRPAGPRADTDHSTR